MAKLTVIELAESYLPVEPVLFNKHKPKRTVMGSPPTLDAELVRLPDKKMAIHYDPDGHYHDPVLHELMHALLGPKSLMYEGALMVMQWKMMKLLVRQDYVKCRDAFGLYSLGQERDVEHTDSFLRTKAWKACVDDARKWGVITRTGRLRKRTRIHSGWTTYRAGPRT